jgi:predicted N-acetyltransferase YhbS
MSLFKSLLIGQNREMKHYTLKEKPELRASVLELIEKSFEYTMGNSFTQDFYPLMRPENAENNHVWCAEDGEVIGHVGVCFRNLVYQKFSYPIVLMGGIAVNQKFRGQGSFRQMIEEILPVLEPQGVMLLLWSSLQDFYNKWGFVLAGEQWDVSPYPHEFSWEKVEYAKLSRDDKKRMQDLYQQISDQAWTIERNTFQWQALEKMPGVECYLRRENTTILGYVLRGKGHDLKNLIHEAVVDETSPIKNKLWLELAGRRRWVVPHPRHQNFPHQKQYLGWMKLGSHPETPIWVESYTQDKLQLLSWSAQSVQYAFQGQNLSMPPAEFLPIVWGPHQDAELKTCRPLWVAGIDSV